jgi:hypothetical protein
MLTETNQVKSSDDNVSGRFGVEGGGSSGDGISSYKKLAFVSDRK